MTSELASTREREHDWIEYDEHHKACRVCGLRLFWSNRVAYGKRGWVLMNHNGQPSPHLLGGGGGGFGRCDPPPEPPIAGTVIIEYTGDPDVHPGCERYMHAFAGTGRDDSAALLDLGTVRPLCGWECQWWEIGPAREHDGWTWCGDCFRGRGPRRARELERKAKAELGARTRPLPARPPRQLPGKR